MPDPEALISGKKKSKGHKRKIFLGSRHQMLVVCVIYTKRKGKLKKSQRDINITKYNYYQTKIKYDHCYCY